MNCIIRLMTREDAPHIIDMMRVFYASPAVLSNGSEEIFRNDVENCVNDSPYLEGYVMERVYEPENHSHIENAEAVERLETEILGYGMVAKSFSTEFGKPCMWIEDLYLKEDARGQEIGSSFLNYIAEKYPEAILRLEVEEENERAIHTYRKCGFEVLPYMEMKR